MVKQLASLFFCWALTTQFALADALIVADDSTSQTIGTRREQTEKTVAALQEQLLALPNISVRTIHAGASITMKPMPHKPITPATQSNIPRSAGLRHRASPKREA